ncbi:MAG: cysteine desulfurase family protein [Clostridia bacterium]
MIYFDNAATTRVCDAAKKQLARDWWNPSSLHGLGLAAEDEISAARQAVAQALGATPREIFFTSGGTEGNNIAILGGMSSARGNHIITTAVEHASILEPIKKLACDGTCVTYLAPSDITEDGVLAALRSDTALISIMSVNNETGAIFPLFPIARAVRAAGYKGLIHTDAVQAFMKIPISLRDGLVDLVTVSGHKIHAPKGVGALYIRRGTRIAPRTFGGSQEGAMRPGTQNVPGIAALRAAIESYLGVPSLMGELKSALADIPCVQLICKGDAPHIVAAAIPGFPSEVIMRMLEERGIYISAGSACSRGKKSHVIAAYNLPPRLSDSAVRISISNETTRDEISEFAAAIRELFMK